jgi:hypothetical protein
MKNVIDVTPLPTGLFARFRSFYNSLREDLNTRQLREAETELNELRKRTEMAMNCFLACAATLHPLHRRQMEEKLLEALLKSMREIQAQFSR